MLINELIINEFYSILSHDIRDFFRTRGSKLCLRNKRKMATLKNEFAHTQRAKLKEHDVQRRERRQNEKCIKRGVDTRERG